MEWKLGSGFCLDCLRARGANARRRLLDRVSSARTGARAPLAPAPPSSVHRRLRTTNIIPGDRREAIGCGPQCMVADDVQVLDSIYGA